MFACISSVIHVCRLYVIMSTLKISRGKVITNNKGSLINVAFNKRITAFQGVHTSGLDKYFIENRQIK